MAQWGRAAASTSPGGAPSGSLGKWSVLLALIALVLVVASFIVFSTLPDDAPGTETVATAIFLVVFAGVAPVLHMVGLAFGLIALFRGNDRRLLGGLGLLLNLLLVGAGLFLAWAGLQGMAAFT